MQFVELTFSGKTLMLDMDKVIMIEQEPVKIAATTNSEHPITYKGAIIIYHPVGSTQLDINNDDKEKAIEQFNLLYSKIYNFIRKRQKTIEKIN